MKILITILTELLGNFLKVRITLKTSPLPCGTPYIQFPNSSALKSLPMTQQMWVFFSKYTFMELKDSSSSEVLSSDKLTWDLAEGTSKLTLLFTLYLLRVKRNGRKAK